MDRQPMLDTEDAGKEETGNYMQLGILQLPIKLS